jgi:hypothetical protein
LGSALGASGGWLLISSESRRYKAAGEEAQRFATRMGVVHGGCANQSCSGLRNGKPVTYFCTPRGCAFDVGQP